MTNKVIEILTEPRSFLGQTDISVDDKKALLEFMAPKGFTQSTFYLRFMQKGFDPWEIEGVKKCKRQFLDIPQVAEALLKVSPVDDAEAKGYFYTLAMGDKPGLFYQSLQKANAGLCNKFIEFMTERGMSGGTVIKRFTSEQWKPWELEGIRSLLETFYDEDK